jgi:hypothetical protein
MPNLVAASFCGRHKRSVMSTKILSGEPFTGYPVASGGGGEVGLILLARSCGIGEEARSPSGMTRGGFPRKEPRFRLWRRDTTVMALLRMACPICVRPIRWSFLNKWKYRTILLYRAAASVKRIVMNVAVPSESTGMMVAPSMSSSLLEEGEMEPLSSLG